MSCPAPHYSFFPGSLTLLHLPSSINLHSHADTVLRIDPGSQAVTEIGRGRFSTGRHRTDGKYKYLGGVLGADGCIYGIPSDADKVLRIDPRTQAVDEVNADILIHSRFRPIVTLSNLVFVCAPT